jgi:hypothetical protein
MPVLLVEVSVGVAEPDSVPVAELAVLLSSAAGEDELGSISGKMNRLIKREKKRILTTHRPRMVNFSFTGAGTGFGTGAGTGFGTGAGAGAGLMISLKVP